MTTSAGRGARVAARRNGQRRLTLWLLVLLVPGMALLDTSIGLLGAADPATFSPGQALRGLLLLMAVPVVLFARRLGRLRLWVLALMAAGSVSVAGGLLLPDGSFYFDLRQVGRALFGPLLVVLLASVFLRWGVRWKTLLLAMAGYGAVCGTLLVGLWLAGSGLPTYGDYSAAFAGFFAAPNDTGLAMLIALVAATALVLSRPGPVSAYCVAATLAGLAVLGTRAAVVGALAVPTAVLLANRSLFTRGRWYGGLVALALLGAGLWGFAAFQQERLAGDPYLAQRFEVLKRADLQRIRPLDESLAEIRATDPLVLVVGQGASAYRTGSEDDGNAVGAEVDWLDLFGAHGLFFTVLLYGFYLRYLLRGRSLDEDCHPAASSVLHIALLVYLVHGALGGHALVSPTSSGMLAPLLAVASVRGPRS